MTGKGGLYQTAYANFASEVRVRMRREVFGEDIGQHSWTTAEELQGFAARAGWNAATQLLEVGCGAGGPAVFLAQTLGSRVTGIDIDAAGIAAACAAAERAAVAGRAAFHCLDGAGALPFAGKSFDGVLVMDAINHFADRPGLLNELHRVLREGGTLLYTDPVVVTGPVTHEEFAIRSANGFFVYGPPGWNEELLAAAGFALVATEDVTSSASLIAGNWVAARQKWREALIATEGAETAEASMRFYRAVHDLARNGRLSRIMYLARRV